MIFKYMKIFNPTVYLLTFFFIDMMRLLDILPRTIGNISYVILGFVIFLSLTVSTNKKINIIIPLFLFFYTLFGALNVLLIGNMDYIELIWPVAFIGVSLIILYFPIDHKVFSTMYILVSTTIFLIILFSDGINQVSLTSSRNTISITLLLYFSLYVISADKSNQKVNISYIVIGLIISVLSIGRSGILTFSILLILFLLFDYKNGKYIKKNFFKVFMSASIIFVFLFFIYNSFGYYFQDTITNFKNNGLESVRTLIWSDYIQLLQQNSKFIFLGAPIEGTYLLDIFNENLHNSFLMLHAKYGLLMLLCVIGLTLYSLLYYLFEKKIALILIFIAILFRMQFDYTNFNAPLDVIFYYLIFYPYVKRENKNIESEGT